MLRGRTAVGICTALAFLLWDDGATKYRVEAAEEADMKPVDFSQLELRGDLFRQDTFSLTVQEAARLMGIESDYETIYALSTNAFAPDIRPDEPCRISWAMQGKHLGLDIVAGRLGLRSEALPRPGKYKEVAPPEPEDEALHAQWFADTYRKPYVPILRKWMARSGWGATRRRARAEGH